MSRMAFHWCDNLHTTVFTPRDFQVELLAATYERNTIICLRHKSSKQFISLKLLQELARETRQDGKLSVYLTQDAGAGGAPTSIYTMLTHLTDLKVWQESEERAIAECDVCILHPKMCLEYFRNGTLRAAQVHLLMLDDCHDAAMHQSVIPIIDEFIRPLKAGEEPKILGLAGPLHSAGCALEELDAMLSKLEADVLCKTETASDVVTVLRYCAKPHEYIVQCAPFEQDELTFVLEDMISTRIAFLKEHRYDPYEIYGGEQFLDELKDIPDPKAEPIDLLETLLTVLHEMGPWGADRVALYLYQRIEKQKIKTPHERHYLLLSVVNTGLMLIHAICEQTFQKLTDHKQIIETYSSPKVNRLLGVLRLFKPAETHTQNETMRRIRNELEHTDFQKLTRTLEYSCQTVEHVVEKQQLESRSIIENLDPILKPTTNNAIKNREQYAAIAKGSHNTNAPNNKRQHNNQNGRTRRRPFIRRHHRENDLTDSLCGLIYCNNNHTARVLFELLAEMSRYDLDLKFLRCQYTTDRVADPVTEPKEAEAEHRRQEEVLKRFRMHDCNVLIGTSVLEEGIDVPKCNLVVRWDPPTTYRSYVQCKGRARAVPAYHVILVAPSYDIATATLTSADQLNDNTHSYTCKTRDDNELDAVDDSDEDDDDTDDSDESTGHNVLNGVGKGQSQYTFGSSKGTVKILNPEILTNQPPTASELTLKEINDEQLALENKTKTSVNGEVNLNVKLNIISLEDALAESESESSKTETSDKLNSSASDKIAPKKEKEKKRFQCELANAQTALAPPCDTELVKKVEKMIDSTHDIVNQLAQYREIEKMLLEKCANAEPLDEEHRLAERFTNCFAPYKPQPELLTGAAVDLSNAIALVNKYCSKLPSDTFTKLTALWRTSRTERNGAVMFQCTLRLPINSPLKHDIVGVPMATEILARRMASLQACIVLHKAGELDNNLQPIGKEGFRAIEADWESFDLETADEKIVRENMEPRPGTTKRRQYYYKRITSEFCNCRPVAGKPCYFYMLDLTLQCPIPEEQNTRGRKIYPPEDAQQGFGILTLKKIPKVSSFPIFTRSGEVKVSIVLSKEQVELNAEQIECINTFLNYTFTNVLRLKKFLMLFDPDSTENCVFIVPTLNTPKGKIIDWDFLKLIAENSNVMPLAIPEDVRKAQEFDANKFKDAVVMPWYRNQDQPQYFYVAEICPQLSPLSCFPGENYRTFKHYYFLKYGLTIENSTQPLLDVDHTSARLNFLTPRYVNRKGVALPTSSEATKRAKRENLEQKQILVPELCTVHPFPASLWRTAVCLPCILYRINGLLLADDIRKQVSDDIALGQQEINQHFEWPMLDFGWSLSEVLKKSRDCKRTAEESKPETETDCDEVKTSKSPQEPSVEKDVEVVEKSANELIIEGEQKLQDSALIEIGTWSNDMANDINFNDKSDYSDDEEEAEFMKYLPANVSFCDQQTRYGSPTFWDVRNSTNGFEQQKHKNRTNPRNNSFSYYSDDSFSSSYEDEYNTRHSNSEEDEDSGHIEFTSRNEAETIETEQEIAKRSKQLLIIQETNANERNYQETKNLHFGYDFGECESREASTEVASSVARFRESIDSLKANIVDSGMLVNCDQTLKLPKQTNCELNATPARFEAVLATYKQLLPYVEEQQIIALIDANPDKVLTIDDLLRLNAEYVDTHPEELYTIVGCGDIFDKYNDHHRLQNGTQEEKQIRIRFNMPDHNQSANDVLYAKDAGVKKEAAMPFSFDYQPDLADHPGPSPSIILQALTMSNANDGINLERLETIGDSFLKYAITSYLYITYENVHEGKLSHLRSKQVANLNLYRLGRRKMLGEYMIATKFEPHDNWLPPCYYVPKELEKELIEAKIPPQHWKLVDLLNIKKLSSTEICALVREKADKLGLSTDELNIEEGSVNDNCLDDSNESNDFSCFIPYNLVTQHSIPDKSIADCVEALIGAYLIECGPRGALLFMAWLGIRVLPFERKSQTNKDAATRLPGSTKPTGDASDLITVYGAWPTPRSPLLFYAPNAQQELTSLLAGFNEFEDILGYKFSDRSYLLQAMTHASYTPNRLTDCYQRLEFLGDAVLDYLITRHLYEDPRQHSPGALTDLRSALVNNTIFASLAVRHGFHKYFRHLSPGLNEVIDRFVRIQEENGHSISEEYYLLSEEECDDAEDVEVPKALGDVFESIAGAIFLDSKMSLDVVWQVYSNMMKPEIEQFSNSVPKSPIRELLELEPETAKFGKPEKLTDGRRVRVTVEVFCKGTFRGIGRNYRIAKCTAAKCALRQLKKQGLITKKD